MQFVMDQAHKDNISSSGRQFDSVGDPLVFAPNSQFTRQLRIFRGSKLLMMCITNTIQRSPSPMILS